MITPKNSQDHQAVALHYDELDAFYRQIWEEHVHHGQWVSGKETPMEAVQNLVRLVADSA